MMLYFNNLDEAHLEWARTLHNDPEVLGMLTDPREVTPEEQVEWFTKLQRSTSSERWLVFNSCERCPIGLVRLDAIDHCNKSICIGLDIHKDFRGTGLARPVYRKLFEEWFVVRGFNRVWLMVAGYNARARHIYTSLGFKEEGIQREALLKNGVFHDYIIMSILKREYVGKEY